MANKGLGVLQRCLAEAEKMTVEEYNILFAEAQEHLTRGYMAHAEKCPVCDGSGKVKVDDITIDCHGCAGKGWVTVHDYNTDPRGDDSDIDTEPIADVNGDFITRMTHGGLIQ